MIIEFLLNNPYILLSCIALIFIVVFVVLFGIFSRSMKKATGVASSVKLKTLLITVPKQKDKDDSQAVKIEELLAEAESWYANIGGIKSQKGIKSDVVGRDDHFCFEIVREKDGLISFYISVPSNLEEFIEQQIHAKYPAAQITEVADFNAFDPGGYISGATLTLKKHQVFPINTYKTIGSDPLDAITNSLSKLGEGESATIQFVLRSARPDWHKVGSKIASDIQQGKSVSSALSKHNASLISKIFDFVLDIFATSNRSDGDSQIDKKDHRLSPMEEETVKALEQKVSKAGFDVNIRIIVCGKDKTCCALFY